MTDTRTLLWALAALYVIRLTILFVPTATTPLPLALLTDVFIPAGLAADLLIRPYPNGPPGMADYNHP